MSGEIQIFKLNAHRFGFVDAGLALFFGRPGFARCRENMPEFGVRDGELYSDHDGFRIEIPDIHDLAYLLSLRRLVDQHQFLSNARRNIQLEKRAMRTHIDRARFFIK